MILLPGGPTHIDTFDLKPDAPTEIRGEFQPIPTNVDGMQICGCCRSPSGRQVRGCPLALLDLWKTITRTGARPVGRTRPDSSPLIHGFPGGWPSLGMILSTKLGPRGGPDLHRPDAGRSEHDSCSARPGRLSRAGPPASKRRRSTAQYRGRSHSRSRRTAEALLASFDGFRRSVERTETPTESTNSHRQALAMPTSPRPVRSADLSAKTHRPRASAGLDHRCRRPGGKTYLDQFLSRGVRLKPGTLRYSRVLPPSLRAHDAAITTGTGTKTVSTKRADALPLRVGLSALAHRPGRRGLLDDVAIVMWGEFGLPEDQQRAGRDHWPARRYRRCRRRCTGQFIGSTTRWAEEPLNRPVHFREVFATLYEQLGLDVATPQRPTLLAGRPQYLVGDHRPLPELA
ncbi:MAG: DUF1501 domain-containing protein [Planctomycetaceae bacterium]